MAQARREAKYPEEVFARAAEVFVRHEFADLPVEVAHHALGVTRRRLLRHPPRAHHGVDDAGAGRGVALKRVAQPSMTARATVTSVNEWRVEFANQVMSADNRATLHVDQRTPGGGALRRTIAVVAPRATGLARDEARVHVTQKELTGQRG